MYKVAVSAGENFDYCAPNSGAAPSTQPKSNCRSFNPFAMRFVLFSSLLLGLLTGCAKTAVGPTSTGSRDVQVQYQVTATGATKASLIGFTDQQGNITQVNEVALPATYTFTRRVATGASLSIVATVAAPLLPTTLTANILVDGQLVNTQTSTSSGGGSGAPSATANISYVVP